MSSATNDGSWREFPLPDGEGGFVTHSGRTRPYGERPRPPSADLRPLGESARDGSGANDVSGA